MTVSVAARLKGVKMEEFPDARQPVGAALFAFMRYRTNQLLVVAAALVDGDGRVLVQQRPAGKPMADLWEFPGGKVDLGETPELALIRELHEELGIETAEACLAPATFASEPVGGSHLLLLLYVCRKWRGIPRPLAAQALTWRRPLELHALEMPPADRPLISILEALV